MKIAVVTDDGKTITQHFGRALGYLVFTVEDGEIIEKTLREKPGHRQFATEPHDENSHEHGHGSGAHSAAKHTQMLDPIRDCSMVVARGMGTGAYNAIAQANMQPIVTDIQDAEEAVRAHISGSLVDHPERLH